MNRRNFIKAASALAVTPALAESSPCAGSSAPAGRFLFGVVDSEPEHVRWAKDAGYDFCEMSVAPAFDPEEDDEWWKRRRDELLAFPLPIRSCNGFLPGSFRLTGPDADFDPALAYAETALRRAEEIGVKTIVFGSSGARNVPGDITGSPDERPNVEAGYSHAVALVMSNAALRTGLRATFDPAARQVLAGGRPWAGYKARA